MGANVNGALAMSSSTGLRRWCLMILAVVLAVSVSACASSADDEPEADASSPAPAWADEVPKGVKIVDKGHKFVGNGSKGEPQEALGVVLKNTTDEPLVLRVGFAVWKAGNTDPWWQSPENEPVIVAIMPGEKVGTGQTLEGTEEDENGSVSEMQVQVSKFGKDTVDGEPVGFSPAAVESGETMTAEPTGFGHPNEVTFTVDNPYSEAVDDIGMGLVLIGRKGKVSGGWNYRPGETVDINRTKFTPGQFPPGKSTHKIRLGALAGSWDLDESTIQIFVWARG